MKALITGGAGFIGSHLSEKLLDRNDEVFVLDDISTGSPDNIRQLQNNHKFHLCVGSVLNASLVAQLISQSDIIFHLAASVGVKLIVEDPINTLNTNILGTKIILDEASRQKKPVVFASTSEVYGKNNKVPFREDDDIVMGSPAILRWGYACSKAAGECLAVSFNKKAGLPVIIIRLFNTIGPRQTDKYGMVVPRFIKQALAGEPLTVFEKGRQSRCFTFVDDVVKAIIDLSAKKQAYGQIYNIGNNEETSILDLAKKVIKITDSKSIIDFIPYNEAYSEGFEDMPQRMPDISKIHKLTGYRPETSLDKALGITIDYFRKN